MVRRLRFSTKRQEDYRVNHLWMPVASGNARYQHKLWWYRRAYHTDPAFRQRALERVRRWYWADPAEGRRRQRERRRWLMDNSPAFVEHERRRDRERGRRLRATPEGAARLRAKNRRAYDRRSGLDRSRVCLNCGRAGVRASGYCGRCETWRRRKAQET